VAICLTRFLGEVARTRINLIHTPIVFSHKFTSHFFRGAMFCVSIATAIHVGHHLKVKQSRTTNPPSDVFLLQSNGFA
jgi:hypothetical protein